MTPRPQAHDAIRDALDLIGLLNQMAAFPNAVTDGDREVMAYRLRCLNNACAPLLRMSVVTVRAQTPGGEAA